MALPHKKTYHLEVKQVTKPTACTHSYSRLVLIASLLCATIIKSTA